MPMKDPIIFMKEVSKLTNLSRPTIDKYIKVLDFPKPAMVGNKKAWYESAIIDWIEKQMVKGINNAKRD